MEKMDSSFYFEFIPLYSSFNSTGNYYNCCKVASQRKIGLHSAKVKKNIIVFLQVYLFTVFRKTTWRRSCCRLGR